MVCAGLLFGPHRPVTAVIRRGRIKTPGDIDPDKVGASLHDGVLTVRLGKAAASQPRQIEVKET